MMAGGGQAPALISPVVVSPMVSREERAAGLTWARDWRRRNKPFFDALYGPDYRDAPGYGGWMQQEARGER